NAVGSAGPGVYFRRFNSAGAALSAPQPVGAVGNDTAIGLDGSGNFVVQWVGETDLEQSGGGNILDSEIFFRQFRADGVAAGPVTQANRRRGFRETFSDLAVAPDGSFAITWENGARIWARNFSSTGLPLGLEYRVSTFSGEQSHPAIMIEPGGDYV